LWGVSKITKRGTSRGDGNKQNPSTSAGKWQRKRGKNILPFKMEGTATLIIHMERLEKIIHK
jgi:hypothetical protein